MTWPTSDVTTTTVDAGSDNAGTARTTFLDLIQKFNQARNHVSTFMQGMLDDVDQAAAQATLGLGAAATKAVGTTAGTVAAGDHAHSGVYQPADGLLSALAALTTAANQLTYYTGSDTPAQTTLSPYMRTVLDDADAATAQLTLGIDLSLYSTASAIAATYSTSTQTNALAKVDIQVFDVAGSYTWTKPANAKTMDIFMVGAHAGGGSGRRGATSTDCFGGGGSGQPGHFVASGLEADLFAATETVVVGAKGTGGAAITVNSTNGNAGTAGGVTKFGSLYQAMGANAGAGGGGAGGSGLGGASLSQARISLDGTNGSDCVKGGDSGTTSGSGVAGAPYSFTAQTGFVSCCSGAGGSLSAANAAYAGQVGQTIFNGGFQTTPSGAAGGANTGGAGTTGTIISLGSHRKIRLGGGGGGAALSAAGGAGGVPGGGGGASRDGNNSGKGADGLDGLVVVYTRCGS